MPGINFLLPLICPDSDNPAVGYRKGPINDRVTEHIHDACVFYYQISLFSAGCTVNDFFDVILLIHEHLRLS
jgi:hypothetical protein